MKDKPRMKAGMKNQTCSACGQTLPLAAGHIVQFTQYGPHNSLVRGVVTRILNSEHAEICSFEDGLSYGRRILGLTRLHGHFHITEREVLSR